MQESTLLLLWAESHLASLKAEHLARLSNTTADWLSRQRISDAEWQLNPETFQMGTAKGRSLCLQTKHSASHLHITPTHSRSPGIGRSADYLASGSPLCLPSLATDSSVSQEGSSSTGRGNPSNPTLAKKAMVLRRSLLKSGRRVETPSETRSSSPGTHMASTSRAVPTDSLEVERQALAKQSYPF